MNFARCLFGAVFTVCFSFGVSVLRADPPATQPAAASQSAPRPVNGRIEVVDNVRVLTLFGTPSDRGYAHGRLLAREIITLLDSFLADGRLIGGLEGYRQRRDLMSRSMFIAPNYEDELRGMLSGIEEALDGDTEVPTLKRKLEYEDLVGVNCMPDAVRLGCSSFAAWGKLTADGGTIAGRNLDWHPIKALDGAHVVIVHRLQADEKRQSWVSIAYPGIIGCLTGMSADGLTVSMHDVEAGKPDVPAGFVPRALALRDAIELASTSTAADDIARLLRRRPGLVGNNVGVAFPSTHGSPGMAVLEYDGKSADERGVTLRATVEADSPPAPIKKRVDPDRETARPQAPSKGPAAPDDGTEAARDSEKSASACFLICTNHYRARQAPSPCDRYESLDHALEALVADYKTLDVPGAWDLLRRVDRPTPLSDALLTLHSVVFEPNRRRMHVAFSRGRTSAAECKPVTLDVARLTSGRE